MNTHRTCRLFALLLCMMLGTAVMGTTAYIADAAPVVCNTFIYEAPPVEPDVPDVPDVPPVVNLPHTGDSSNLLLWGALMMLAAGSGMAISKRRA